MSCTSKIAGLALLSFVSVSHAGFFSNTAHSRANCVNNESITWNGSASHDWRVLSFHNVDYNNPNRGYHYIDTGMSYTWRQAAVHWGESGLTGTYLVSGFHYYLDNGRQLLDVNTVVTDCSVYDGWWDRS